MMFRCGGVALALALVCGARQADAGYCNGAIPCPTSLHAPGAIGDVTPDAGYFTTLNKLTLTQPATGATLTIADGKTLTDTSGVGAKLLLGATGGGFTGYAGVSGVSHKWIASLDTAGAGTLTQPATGDLSDISTFNLSTSGTGSLASLTLTGTAGAGFAALPHQSSNPASVAGKLIVFATGAGSSGRDLSIKNQGGFTATFGTGAINADHTYALPDVAGTLITTGDTGSVTNTMLANSAVTVGSTSIALGATSTSLAGLTTVSMNNQLTNSLAIGTAPFVITSTTRVANLNVATAGNADTVTTNANLTGPITSSGNATSIASQTGTGTKFVVDTAPTLADPILNGYHASTAQLDKTSNTTFASITGLTSNTLTSGATYVLRGRLSTISGASGGIKVRISSAGALTVTSLDITAHLYNGTTLAAVQNFTALGTSCAFTGVVTDIYFEGSFVVNVAGSYLVQAAQNVSNGTTTSVFINSEVSVVRVN